VSAVHRLAPRSEACPLSLRHLLRALAGAGRPLPLFAAPHPALARAALLAAKRGDAAVGLGLPPGSDPEGWFAAVTRAADELAPGLPFFLSGEVSVAPGVPLERAAGEAHRLVEGGVTHLAVEVGALPEGERGRAAAEVAGPAAERELAVDLVLPAGLGPEEALVLLEEARGWGLEPDALSVRGAASARGAELQGEARVLAAVAAAVAPTPVVRRGPLPAPLAAAVRGLGVAGAEDGGRVRDAAGRGLSAGGRAALSAPWARGAAPPALEPAEEERAEGLAFAEAAALLEAMGAGGTAAAAAAVLLAGARR
jgi:hypothetical protein